MQEDTRYKTFWRRLGANIIDSLIIGFAAGIILVPVLVVVVASSIHTSATGEPEFEASRGEIAAFAVAILLATVGSHVYTIWMLAARGQTIGKMATGIVVRDAVTGGAIGFQKAFMRSLGELVIQFGSLVLAGLGAFGDFDRDMLDALNLVQSLSSWGWWIAEVLTMLTNPRRRALHDLIAGTVVVKTSYEGPAAAAAFGATPPGTGW
jgi:uncharacterized RDD family membrane protein YckC